MNRFLHVRRVAALAALAAALAAVLNVPANLRAQSLWTGQSPATTESFRGISLVGGGTLWMSGTHGTFMWTADGGTHWHVGVVPGAASLDFRDVHAVSLDTAILMVAGQDTARIYRTTDRGRTWSLQYDDVHKGAFLDALAFFDSRRGLALGDPMDGRFVVLRTTDGGGHWARIPAAGLPPALPGEGAFAASGTALMTCGSRDVWFGTGGAARARVFHSRDGGLTWHVSETPIAAANAAAGIFSLACRDSKHGIAVGGNYARPDGAVVTVAYTDDAAETWTAARPSSATAFLSAVAYTHQGDDKHLIGVGTEGTAYSSDGGLTWTRRDSLSLNAVAASRSSAEAWAAGARGKVERLGSPPVLTGPGKNP